MPESAKLVIATRNQDKVAEIKAILSCFKIEFLSLIDFENVPDIVEDGLTFEDNARKKAIEVWWHTRLPSLADDSGLVVDCLGGEPGVHSRRFAGESATYDENNRKLLSLLKGVPLERRKARFVCVAALVTQEEKVVLSRGELEGYIIDEMRGEHGFGYDPIFYLPEYGKTVAELKPQIKNTISHRARAIEGLKKAISELVATQS